MTLKGLKSAFIPVNLPTVKTSEVKCMTTYTQVVIGSFADVNVDD